MYLICTLPRTGGHLLISLLNATNACGNVVIPEMFDRWESLFGVRYDDRLDLSDEELRMYFDNFCVSPDTQKFIGSKCWIANMPMVLKMFAVKGIEISDVKWIYLRRDDLLKQSISHTIASETDKWHSYDEHDKIENEHFPISLEQVRVTLFRFYIVQLQWESFFEKHGIQPFRITYEDFEYPDQWSGKISEVLDFFEVGYEYPLNLSTFFHRTATGLNDRVYDLCIV